MGSPGLCLTTARHPANAALPCRNTKVSAGLSWCPEPLVSCPLRTRTGRTHGVSSDHVCGPNPFEVPRQWAAEPLLCRACPRGSGGVRSCFPSDFQSKALSFDQSVGLCRHPWSCRCSLLGVCVPSWKPACAGPECIRQEIAKACPEGRRVAVQGTQGQGRPWDCTERQPIPADHGQAGICKVGHIVISPQKHPNPSPP